MLPRCWGSATRPCSIRCGNSTWIRRGDNVLVLRHRWHHRLEKPRIPIPPLCLPTSRKAVTVRSEDSLCRRRKFVGLGETIDLANPSPVCRGTLYLFTLGGLSGIFKNKDRYSRGGGLEDDRTPNGTPVRPFSSRNHSHTGRGHP